MPYPVQAFWAVAYLSGYVFTFAILIAARHFFPGKGLTDDEEAQYPILLIACATFWPIFWIWAFIEIRKNNPWQ